MAAQDEVIRYVYEVSGSKELQEVARQLIETGGASEDVEAQIKGLADEFGKLGQEAAQAADLQKAADTFRDLARAVLETEKGITSAKAKVAELGKAISATEEPTKKQTREFEASRRELDKLERAQAKQRGTLSDLKKGFTDAGVSTRSLGAAEKELAARIQESQTAMAGLVTSARATVTARNDAARAERALLDQLRSTVAQQQQAARATENLQRARELLAQRSTTASATERQYAQSLGTSAAKIAAIGAAAIGITSSVQLARNGLSQLIETAGEFQKLDVQLDGVFGEGSTDALTAIQKFAQETPYQLQQVSDSFVKLKAFGLDPLDGTFQAIADQAAKLGGAQETLTGITLALGQAQAKQKLQGEEILQLVERGVPVWDLLSRATGKNVQELQKLSEAGKLGRTEIKLLIDEIGKSSEGASAALANTLPGQINRLQGQWSEFLNLIANSGVLDYLQEQLADISAEVSRMAASGELQEWATDIADAIVTAAEAIKGITGFLYDHREAITALAAAYGAFKTAQVIGGMATAFAGMATHVATATRALLGATAASSAFLGPLGLLAAALAFTANATINLVQNYRELEAEWAEAEAAAQDFLDTNEQLLESSRKAQEQYAAFADVAIEKSGELASKSEADTQAYIEQLKGAIDYTVALGNEAIATGDNVGKIAARARLEELRDSLGEAEAQMVALREASALAFDTVGKVGIEAAEKFDDLIAKGKSAKEAVEGIFKDVDFTKAEGFANAAEQIKAIGARGTEAAEVVRKELRAQIIALSDEDFAKFRLTAPAAFASAMQGARELQGALEGINLERLGVDIEEIKTGFSSAGRAAIESFSAAREEVDGLGLTAQQRAEAISRAFEAAFGATKTKADIEALGAELSKAFDKGEIGVEQYMAKLDEANKKIASIGDIKAPNVKPITDGLQQVQQGAQSAGDAVQQVGDQAEKAGDKATKSGGSFQALASVYAGWINQFLQTSKAAADEFQRLTRSIFESRRGMVDFTGLARFGEAMNQASKMVEEGIDRQKIAAAALADQYSNLSDSAIQDMIRMRGGVDAVASGMDLLAQSAREGKTEFNLLGAADLGPLASAAAAAAAQVRQIGEEAVNTKRDLVDMADSIRDQIDQINGDQDSSENRRHERELARIKERAEAAGAANSGEYNDLIAAANELHALKLRQIRQQEAEARKAADASNSSSGSSGSSASNSSSGSSGSSGSGGSGGLQPININVGNGQTATVFGTPAQANSLAALLEQLARSRTLSGG